MQINLYNIAISIIIYNTVYINVQAIQPFSDSLLNQLIPKERRIDWNPGIPAGIPNIEGPIVNVIDNGADPAGSLNSQQAFQSAINKLAGSGGVVYVPNGRYRIENTIFLEHDNIVLRGNGSESKIFLGADNSGILITSNQLGDWQFLTGTQIKGDNYIVVDDGSKFLKGGFAEIEQDDDTVIMFTSPEWITSWSENSVGQLFRIEEIIEDTLIFESTLNIEFRTRLNARIRPLGLVQNVGIENLYLEKTVPIGSTVLFKNTAYSWIRQVESYHTGRSHVEQTRCLKNEIRDSYFHHAFSYGGGGSGYGVECGYHTTGCLVENNIFDSLRHAMIVQMGANGNVYGYNFSRNTLQGDGETDLTPDISPDISIHGHYPFMNLFEGNEVEEIGIGDWWGPAGPGNTFFRNRVNLDGVVYWDASHSQNVIGNVISKIQDQHEIAEDKLEHGNLVAGIINWDPEISIKELPKSLYLYTVPGYMHGYVWPAFGPDVNQDSKLPGEERYEFLITKSKTDSIEKVVAVYPNPCSTILYIHGLEIGSNIRLVSLAGQVVQDLGRSVSQSLTLNLSDLERGIYLLQIRDNSGVLTTKRLVLI